MNRETRTKPFIALLTFRIAYTPKEVDVVEAFPNRIFHLNIYKVHTKRVDKKFIE